MSHPKISVLMPVRNAEAFIGQALDSLLAQSFGDFKLLVVDDGSTDGTPDVLATCRDPRLTVFRQEPRGLVATLNALLDLADTEFVARHDGDDLSHPERFARQMAFFAANPEVGLLGSCARIIDQTGNPCGEIILPCDHEEIVSELPRCNRFTHGSVMLRKAVADRAGRYNPLFIHGEDYEYWFRVSRVCRCANLSEQLYSYRLHPDQIQATQQPVQESIRSFVAGFSVDKAYTLLMGSDTRPRVLLLSLGGLNPGELESLAQRPGAFAVLSSTRPEMLADHLEKALGLLAPAAIFLAGCAPGDPRTRRVEELLHALNPALSVCAPERHPDADALYAELVRCSPESFSQTEE